MDVETGDNRLFMVAFLYVLQATTLDKLRRIVSDFHMVAREKTVECCACYSLHPEAFLSGYPTNRVYVGKKGLISETPVLSLIHIWLIHIFCVIPQDICWG